MKILLANHHFFNYTGSETFAYTLARGLQSAGCDVTLYAPFSGGAIVEQTREHSILVVDDANQLLKDTFDVLLVSHNLVAIELRQIFPATPMLLLSHGVLPFLEQPPIDDLNISFFLAVSEEVRDHLIRRGVGTDRIRIFRNVIDTERFMPSAAIRDRPERVLVLSGRIDAEKLAVIQGACARVNAEMRRIGMGFADPCPENQINQADLCISLGRGILESMACGRAALVYDYNGGDGLVTPENIDEIQKNNFSGRRFKKMFTAETLAEEIARYRPEMGKINRGLIEEQFSVKRGIPALLELFGQAQQSFAKKSIDAHAAFMAQGLRETRNYTAAIFGPQIEQRNQRIEQLTQQAEQLSGENRRLNAELQSARGDLDRIAASSAWKMITRYYGLRDRLLPVDSFQRKAMVRAGRLARGVLRLNPVNAYHYLQDHGWAAFATKIRKKLMGQGASGAAYVNQQERYDAWRRENEPGAARLLEQAGRKFQKQPKISIVVPVFETPEKYLLDLLGSVARQTYANWELILADGHSRQPHVRRILREQAARDPRIRTVFLEKNLGIAGNTNAAIATADGDYVAFVDHDDTLPPFALYALVESLNTEGEADLIYTDEDKLSADGKRRSRPFFKPDLNPALLRSFNYLCHWVVVRREFLRELGGLREGFDGAQDYDLLLRAVEKTQQIRHLPRVLYHWRAHGRSAAGSTRAKRYAYAAGKRALAEHLQRSGQRAEAADGALPGTYRVRYAIDGRPKVSIIIPNHEHPDDLAACIRSIVDRTAYPEYEILIVENHSQSAKIFDLYRDLQAEHKQVKVLTFELPFNFSAINNFVAKSAAGEYLLFLNNDTKVINPDWLERMLEHAQQKDVGAVGAKLYYPDGTIQHAGVVVGPGGLACHLFLNRDRDDAGYAGLLKCAQDLSAVTGACLMTPARIFREVGGFDEKYPLALSDIDYCLKLRKRELRVIWTPWAELEHHESKTRGYEDSEAKKARLDQEREYFRSKWDLFLQPGDPFVSPHALRLQLVF